MKTAVEWLIEQWPILESQLPQQLIQQAKEMEKEQIIEAYWDGYIKPYSQEMITEAEQYYKETFKSE
jgi:HEPN domain-containing protein